MNFLQTCLGHCDYSPRPEVLSFQFTCDPFQNHSFYHIDNDHNILVTAKTSSGKTTVAEYAICKNVLEGKRVVYTSPVKSLSNEKYRDFKDKFPFSVGLLTGDNKIDPDAQCLVVTAEILENSLYNLKNKIDNPNKFISDDFVKSIGCVIMDEVHYMNDPERGKVWEKTLVLLPPSVQIVMLTGTIGNPEQFAGWIGNIKQKIIAWIPTDRRIIPLLTYIYYDDKLCTVIDENGNYINDGYHEAKARFARVKKLREKQHKFGVDYDMISQLVEHMKEKDLLQCIFFSFSRANCEKFANMVKLCQLTTYEEQAEIRKIFDHHMHSYHHRYENVSQYNTIKDIVQSGVCYHHSGLIPILKEIIEILFRKGLIKVLFATETFAVGVNMPARSVVFIDIKKPSKRSKRLLYPSEFKQMAGRAGRRGMDIMGHVIMLPLYNFINDDEFRTVALGPVPNIISQFKWDYNFVLKVIQSQSFDITEFFKHSLINIGHDKEVLRLKSDVTNVKILVDALTEQHNKLSADTIKKIKTFIDLDRKAKGEETIGAFKITLNKKQLSELKTLTAFVKLHEDDYKTITMLNQKSNELELLEYELHDKETFVNTHFDALVNVLQVWEYLTKGTIDTVDTIDTTARGIIASTINDCNPIILTEMIMGGYLDDMSAEEIVAMVSIFTEPIRSEKDKTDVDDMTHDFCTTPNVHNKLRRLEEFIRWNIGVEADIFKSRHIHLITDWSVSYSYMDLAYEWAKGLNVIELCKRLNELEDHEGNFVKNLMKISNICHDIQCICKLPAVGKNNLIQALEEVDKLIVRDIVTINSIYLGI
jgi:superfamily II RNA helicase